MSLSLKTFIEYAKQEKARAVESEQSEDMLPQLFVIKNDEVVAVVTVPKFDEDLTFRASLLLQIGFKPDELILNMDANIKLKEPTDSLIEDISECIVVHKINKEGKCSVATLPYIKNNKNIKWIKEAFTLVEEGDEQNNSVLDGKFVRTLKKIILTESLDNNKKFKEFANIVLLEKHGVKDEKQLAFHIGRAVIGLLIEMGFHVVDMFSHQHIEWTDAKLKAKEFVKIMVEKGLIDEENKQKLQDVVCQYVGTPSFVEKIEHYLNLYLKKHPKNTTCLDMAKSILFFCMSPV